MTESVRTNAKEQMASSLANVLNQKCLHLRIWREDGVYVAKCLDIPGCVTEGETREEALSNLHDAITLCLQVIQEDAGNLENEPSEVEVIERPLEEFLTL